MDFFSVFKDWHLNRNKGGQTYFNASFSLDFNPNQLLEPWLELIKNDIHQIYNDENKVKYSESDFLTLDINREFENSPNLIKAFSLYSDDSSLFEYMGVSKHDYNQMEQISFGFNLKQDSKLPINFFELINSKCLFFASYYESDYINWQDKIAVSAYKYRKGLEYAKNTFGQKIVDVSKRPGRSFFTKHFRYLGACKMWFGPQIYRFIPQDRILSFTEAVEINSLDNNITYIHLYETIYDGDEPQNQEVQRRFREHIGIDSLKI